MANPPNSRSMQLQSPKIPHLSKGEIADLRDDVDEALQEMESEVAQPGQAQANIRLNVQATEGDTVVIGVDTYEFVDALGNGVAGGIEVLITDAATQLVNIIDAINGDALAAAADGAGTENVFASAYNTDFLHIENAQREGGAVRPGLKPDITLTETLTGAGDWDHGNLNLTGGDGPLRKVVHVIVVDAFNLLNDFDIVVPGVPVSAQVLLYTDAADVPTAATFDTGLTIVQARNAVTVGLDDATTDPVATDKVYLEITYLAA